jgi:hypothetical protein
VLASLDKSLFMNEGKTYPKVLSSRPRPRNEKPSFSIACDVIGCREKDILVPCSLTKLSCDCGCVIWGGVRRDIGDVLGLEDVVYFLCAFAAFLGSSKAESKSSDIGSV